MEKYFATYTQSLALKELGFDEPCMGKYDTKQGDEWFLNIYSGHLNIQFSDKNKACIAPLKSEVFEWFRERYNILNEITFFRDNKRIKKAYWFTIFKWDDNMVNREIIRDENDLYYYTYEEAESACIDKLIEIIKKK